jgi:hypothetical protein
MHNAEWVVNNVVMGEKYAGLDMKEIGIGWKWERTL